MADPARSEVISQIDETEKGVATEKVRKERANEEARRAKEYFDSLIVPPEEYRQAVVNFLDIPDANPNLTPERKSQILDDISGPIGII